VKGGPDSRPSLLEGRVAAAGDLRQARAVSDVAKLLEGKGSDVLQIDADATVFDAIKRMVESNVGALLVTERGNVAGIVTERDYLRRVTLEGRTEEETLVREIMTAPLVYVTPETSVEECMAVMTERRIRHLPVFSDGRELVGIVSIGDLVKFKSAEQDFQIKFLTEYIESG
jgi:CBS domain-containing protein